MLTRLCGPQVRSWELTAAPMILVRLGVRSAPPKLDSQNPLALDQLAHPWTEGTGYA